ncbi:MAG: amidase [SAR324 cluster bacterium]|nr:amidase [SAR324 cluster bacterium]
MLKDPFYYQTISELASQIQSGSLSPVDLTEIFLKRIASLDPQLQAFKLVMKEQAIAQAQTAEQAIKNGTYLGPLHGIPIAVKDLYDIKGVPTEAGCSMLNNNIADEDSTVVRLLRNSGAVILGKTHTVQFALGGVGINHDHGTPHNPWHKNPHAPGGSSSGTAVAVSSGMIPMALGSDTGGSVRIPASLCGIIGLKTTVGRISRKGVYPLCTTLDTVGPLARSVEDCAIAYQVMQGEDKNGDPTTTGQTPHDVLSGIKRGVKNLRVHFAESAFWEDVDPDVEEAVRKTGDVFKEQGAVVESIDFPEAQEALSIQPRGQIIVTEGYAHNRKVFDGNVEKLDSVVGPRIAVGVDVSGPEYFEILRKMAGLRKQAVDRLSDVDALIVPSTAIPAFPLKEIDQGYEIYSQYNLRYLRNTTIGNLLNLCAVSIPCGITKKGMPIGLMIYAKPFHEEMALRVAYAYEQASSFAQMRPSLDWLNG